MRHVGFVVAAGLFALSFGCSGVKTAPATSGALTVTAVVPSQGPLAGNVPVEIHGTGFVSQNLLVTFGGTAMSNATVVDAQTIHGTLPSHSQPGAVDVAVACANGQATLSNGFTYVNSTQAISITGINPNNGPISGGTSVTITGTGFNAGATTVAFGSNNGTGVTVASDTQLTVITPAAAGSGAVSVTVNNQNGAASLPSAFVYGTVSQGGTVTEHLAGLSEFDIVQQTNNAPFTAGSAVFFAATDIAYPAAGSCMLDLNMAPGVTSTLDAGANVTVTMGTSTSTLAKDTSSGHIEYSLQNGPAANFPMATMAGISAPGASGAVAAFNVAQVASSPAADTTAWLDPLGIQKFTSGGFWSGGHDLFVPWSDNGTAGTVNNPVNHVQLYVMGQVAQGTLHVLQCDLRDGADASGGFCIKGGGSGDVCPTPGNTMTDFWTAIGGPASGFGTATVVLYRGNRSTYDIGGGNTAALDVNVVKTSSLVMTN